MKNYQYVLDIETPFIRKLYDKEDNYKVELLTPYGILEELKKLQEENADLEQKLALTEKALELACLVISKAMCPNGDWESLKIDFANSYKEQAKEMMKSEERY